MSTLSSSTTVTGDRQPEITSANGMIELGFDGELALEYPAVRQTLYEHYREDKAGHAMTPPPDPDQLRAQLRQAAPMLTRLTDQIDELFEQGAGGVLIERLGLTDLDVDQRRTMVFALAVLSGNVTETEPVDHRVIWDVRTTSEDMRQYSHFSQADGEAYYHTDSTIVPIPEKFFLLYAVQQATCGGGLSFFRDGRLLKKRLEETEEGRSAIRTLSEAKLPLRIPRAFRQKYDTPKGGYSYLPVLGELPMWRWRRDKIEHGLVKHPEYATPEVREALATVDKELENHRDEIRRPLPTDGIVIIDNHVAFHGRTAFSDPGRHLLRIRFTDKATPVTAPQG